MKNKPTLLIVDDDPVIRDTIEGLLFKEGYHLTFAASGAETLACLDELNPDLILLDVMMPGMDGFEVCQHLKADKQWRHIPIILITALSEEEDLVRGLDAGADDFLHKPVNSHELRARVRSMLRIKRQYDELEATLRLRENLAHMIMHDIKTPLTAILGYSALLMMSQTMNPKDLEDVKNIEGQTHRLNEFMDDMLIMAKMEAERLILNRALIEVNQLIQQVEKSHDVVALSKKVRLVIDLPSESQPVSLDANLFQRVLDNLISNAVKFSPVEGTIRLQVEYPHLETSSPAAPHLRIKVIDTGPGVPEEYRDRIFDKFEIATLDKSGAAQVGLGLAFCKMVVDAHHGRIFVEPNEPAGSVFIVEI